jgi:hypothetical protein
MIAQVITRISSLSGGAMRKVPRTHEPRQTFTLTPMVQWCRCVSFATTADVRDGKIKTGVGSRLTRLSLISRLISVVTTVLYCEGNSGNLGRAHGARDKQNHRFQLASSFSFFPSFFPFHKMATLTVSSRKRFSPSSASALVLQKSQPHHPP